MLSAAAQRANRGSNGFDSRGGFSNQDAERIFEEFFMRGARGGGSPFGFGAGSGFVQMQQESRRSTHYPMRARAASAACTRLVG